MKQFLVSSVAVFGIGLSAVADYAIWNGGDIVSWGVTPDKVSERILFRQQGSATWTLSADSSIHSGGFSEAGSQGSPQAVTFDFADGNHVLSLTGGNFLIYNHDVEAWFKGGIWNFNGYGFVPVGKPVGAGYGDRNLIVLTNGCTMTDVSLGGNGQGALYASPDVRLVLTGGSTFAAKGGAMLFDNIERADGVVATNMYFEISGGSTFSCPGDFSFDTGSSVDKRDRGNRMLVTGSGSSFTQTGSFLMGKGTGGNVMEVADNATATVGACRLGYASSPNTGFYVHDGATLMGHDAYGMRFGEPGLDGTDKPTAGGMFLKAVNATVKMGDNGWGSFVLASENNSLDLSNATFQCNTFLIGRSATNNVARILGSGTSFKSNKWAPLFGNGGNCLVELGDQANVSVSSVKFDDGTNSHSPSNVLRVTGGAALSVADGVSVGEARSDRAVDNRIEITDGGRLCAASGVTVTGTNNWLIVDNGTFESTYDTSYSLDLATVLFGSAYNGRSSDGCVLVIRGNRPKVKIPKTSLKFDYGAKLRFELPPKGYAYETVGEAPLEIQQLMNYKMDYEIAGLDELQKNLTKSCDIPLVKMTYRMWDGGSAFDALDRINAKLAETNPGCRLWKQNNRSTTGGEIIYLHVKAFLGLQILIR